ncbi:MAG: hypothetical protein ACJAS7_000603 [Alpinimonas sp.]|jgi:hypothetical protein
MHINESVSVETLASGAPIRFVWRGVTYGVVSSPEPWISRRSWWSEGGIRVARGATAGLLAVPMWRVDALPLTDGAHRMDGTFDLAQPVATLPLSPTAPIESTGWVLVTAVSEELDERLFA